MTPFLLDTHSEPLLKVLHRMFQHLLQKSCDFLTNGKFQLFDRAWSVRVHSRLEVSPQKKVANQQIRGTWGAKKHRRNGRSHVWGNCSMANTQCSTFLCTIATETALSELSASSHPMSSTPPLPSTSHFKNMHFLCSTLWKRCVVNTMSWLIYPQGKSQYPL